MATGMDPWHWTSRGMQVRNLQYDQLAFEKKMAKRMLRTRKMNVAAVVLLRALLVKSSIMAPHQIPDGLHGSSRDIVITGARSDLDL